MAVQTAFGGDRYPNSARLSEAQVGNGISTHTVDRGATTDRPALLTITTTVGETPTCTYQIEGSADGSTWWPAAYADLATPEAPSVAPFDITAAGTAHRILRPGHPWRYLRVTYSANTAVTNTADIVIF
ncbi:hypothetical protein [Streptomyces sp. NBC_01237]|uniref:hypothetical protein n=1 Tax=Streptomyces sp. NBC_01237 TaxID=2903790 RepID=UPI002DDAD1CF|nr:hypothetical protein [Streptomyces sp. NBC_01237]WRZ72884.1 hypothetical protein OG251_15300 [Streptomyces sp. NBC_01237]